MFTNAGLLIRLVVAAGFLAAGLLLLRGSTRRTAAALIAIGGALFLAGGLYGLLVLRPFVGRFFDEEWTLQLDIVDVLSTLGLLLCAGGLVLHAARRNSGSA